MNLWRIHLGQKDLQNNEKDGENQTQSVEGSGQLAVGGWKLEEREKILTWHDDEGEMKSSLNRQNMH